MDLSTELYRFGAALAIGALVGFERQSRLEVPPEEWDPGSQPTPAEPPAEESTEESVRAAVAAGESTRWSAAGLREHLRDAPAAETAETAGAEAPAAPEPSESWIPDFHQAVGLRTFILVSLCGALAGSLSRESPWVFVASFLVVGALVSLSYVIAARQRGDIGLTSEISAIAVFLLGGLCAQGQVELAGAACIVITMTLSLKQGLHRLAQKIRSEDIQAVLKFAVLTFIILPMLPAQPLPIGSYLPGGQGIAVVDSGDVAAIDTALVAEAPPIRPPQPPGPLAEIAPREGEGKKGPWWKGLTVSPRKIWFMVILISGISFAGYVLGKVMGTGRGLILTGVVGGLVSSTAVSLSYSQKSQVSPEHSRQLAIGILLANAIMPLRLLVVVGVIAPLLLMKLALPLFAMAAVAGFASLILYVQEKVQAKRGSQELPLKNPFELGPALKFGLLFGAVLFAAEVAQGFFGDAGLYVVAVLTGLTDVDAIGLAVANLVAEGNQAVATGAITIALAAVTNTLVKGGFVATMGSKQLRNITLLSFSLMFVAACAGIALIWAYWA